MTKLLYIEVSPRKERSHSIAVAEAFLDAYSAANPDHEIDKMDLWDAELPELNMAMIDAKYRLLAGDELDEREANAWRIVEATFNRVNSADKIVISTPMWNFNVPYKLKHLIDIIIQPDLAFAVVEGGYEGLVKGKPAMVIVARGGAYPPGSEFYDVDFRSGTWIFCSASSGSTISVRWSSSRRSRQKTKWLQRGRRRSRKARLPGLRSSPARAGGYPDPAAGA